MSLIGHVGQVNSFLKALLTGWRTLDVLDTFAKSSDGLGDLLEPVFDNQVDYMRSTANVEELAFEKGRVLTSILENTAKARDCNVV